jgi:hypothetical protein
LQYRCITLGYEWVPALLAMLKGIEPYEVRQVLEDPRPRWPRRAVGAGGVAVMTVWGRTRAGRRLIVVLRATRSATTG